MNIKRNSRSPMIGNKPKSKVTINSDFCFCLHTCDLKIVNEANEYYKANKKKYQDVLDSDVPIAIDTNILLNLYKISSVERDSFVGFVNKNKSRIILPFQVQEEYLRHRIMQIREIRKAITNLSKDFQNISEGILKFRTSSIEKIKQFKNKALIKGMPDIPEKLSDIIKYIEDNYPAAFMDGVKSKSDAITIPLKDAVEEALDKAISETKDSVMDSISKTILLKKRSSEELAFLSDLYHSCSDEYGNHKNDKENKDLFTFPGSGDWRKEKDGFDPCGDFYIYHELLAYMKDYDTDVYLLTNDTTKGDWVNTDKNPFFHYVTDVYRNTHHMLYFLNATDFTTMSFASMTESDEEEEESCESDDTDALLAEFSSAKVEESCVEEEMGKGSQTNYKKSFYKDITPDKFIFYLKYSLEWFKNTKNGYVKKDDFIKGFLGHKRYLYKSSYSTLDTLIEDGKVELYEKECNGKVVKCLRLKDDEGQ